MELGHTADRRKLNDQEGDDMTPSLGRIGTAVLDLKSTGDELSESSGL